MTILSTPWRIDRRGERIYIDAPGEVCIDLCSGTPEDRARVMALLEQVPEMVQVMNDLLPALEGHIPLGDRYLEVRDALRAAGVLDE